MVGAIEIELVARSLIPSLDHAVNSELVTTARLRCSPRAAASLREAITVIKRCKWINSFVSKLVHCCKHRHQYQYRALSRQ
jgi:hypothetical protein